MTTADTDPYEIELTQFPPDDAALVLASRTPGCCGNIIVSALAEGIELRARGCDELAGPPDDGNPTPNSGTIAGLSPAEARELAAALLDAAEGRQR